MKSPGRFSWLATIGDSERFMRTNSGEGCDGRTALQVFYLLHTGQQVSPEVVRSYVCLL